MEILQKIQEKLEVSSEVRVDLATLPEESRGVSSSFLFSSVMVTGDLDEGRIGGAERHHAIVCQIYGMLESAAKASCSDCPTPTPTRRPGPPAEAVIAWHREAAALETAKQEHIELAAVGLSQPGARPEVPAVKQAIESGNKDRGAKAQRSKKAGQT